MKSTSFLNIAAIVAGLTVLAIAYILVPSVLWTAIAIATVIGLAVAVAFMFFAPSAIVKSRYETDAPQLASIGPISVISLLLLLGMAASFLVAIFGHQTLALAMLVFSTGVFLIAAMMLGSALRIIDDVSGQQSKTSRHTNWHCQVTVLASQSTHRETTDGLHALGEKLRYLASDVPGGSPHDAQIDQMLGMLSTELKNEPASDLISRFGAIQSLLTQREVYLRSVRSKA